LNETPTDYWTLGRAP